VESKHRQLLQRLVAAWNDSDVEAFVMLFEPDCEVVFPPDVPEPGPFHGHAELRQWVRTFLSAWDTHHAEIVEIVEAADTVVAVLHQVGRGAGSGIEMDETDANVFAIRSGRIARWQNFDERGDALAAAGLPRP
jgi:ketosteroid isomerase-like protein